MNKLQIYKKWISLANKQVNPPDQGSFVTVISTEEPLLLRGCKNIIGRCYRYKTFYSKVQKSISNSLKEGSEIQDLHCVKSIRIRSYSGPYFPSFGLNTERYFEYEHFLRSAN